MQISRVCGFINSVFGSDNNTGIRLIEHEDGTISQEIIVDKGWSDKRGSFSHFERLAILEHFSDPTPHLVSVIFASFYVHSSKMQIGRVCGFIVASVLSGNRNFEGRVHPLTRANYLASPPLVVAYALAYEATNEAHSLFRPGDRNWVAKMTDTRGE